MCLERKLYVLNFLIVGFVTFDTELRLSVCMCIGCFQPIKVFHVLCAIPCGTKDLAPLLPLFIIYVYILLLSYRDLTTSLSLLMDYLLGCWKV